MAPHLLLFLLPRHHNKIGAIDGGRMAELSSVETLDLSHNDVGDLRGRSFPAGLRIKDLWVPPQASASPSAKRVPSGTLLLCSRYLNNNKIGALEPGAMDHLGSTLQVLRLSRNRISQIPVRAFQLPRLTLLYVPPDSAQEPLKCFA